ncbi:MAG: carbon-nitrogen hydrolase family protein [Bacillota bacterium]
MRVALSVRRVFEDAGRNLESLLSAIHSAAEQRADLVVSCEASLTGLINDGDPSHDLPLAVRIPGKETSRISDAAKEDGLFVALGLFEREGDSMFDSAILIDPAGCLSLKYRRISQGWRDRNWDPSIFREGDSIPVSSTPFGSMAFLICGDLFDDDLCARVRAMQVDYVLCPVARNFDDDSYDQERWDKEERAVYARRAAMTGATVLMVNQLGGDHESGDSFGGAWVVSREGAILAELPLGKEGILVVDLQEHGSASPASPLRLAPSSRHSCEGEG